MTATLTIDQSTVSTSSRPLLRSGAKAGVVAAAATTTIAGVAHALGVSFESAPGDGIPLLGFAQLTFVFTMVGVLIGRTIRRRSSNPSSTFTKTAVGLTVLSVVPDLALSFDAASKLTLILTHVVAAAIVIPVLRNCLSD